MHDVRTFDTYIRLSYHWSKDSEVMAELKVFIERLEALDLIDKKSDRLMTRSAGLRDTPVEFLP